MSFRFNFDLEVEEGQEVAAGPSRSSVGSSDADQLRTGVVQADERCFTCTLEELLDELPDSIAYAPLHLDFLPQPILRRDLHDARFQLAAASEDDTLATAPETGRADIETKRGGKHGDQEYVDADTDLIPNVYEGGLKTWEGGVDLVQVLSDVEGGAAAWLAGKRSLEVGCGTSLPSCFLLSSLLSSAASTPPKATTLHLQDYNRPVLSLVSLPNLLLAALPHLPVESLRSADDAGDIEDVVIDYEHGGDIAITPDLKDAFVQLLKEKKVELNFTYGHWGGLAREIETEQAEEQGGERGYELVLTAETIYSEASVESLIQVLRVANGTAADEAGANGKEGKVQVGLEDSMENLGVQDAQQGKDGKLALNDGERVILVAAKVLYFGVGGGLQDFIHRIEDSQGWAVSVREWVKGVGRSVVRIGW